MTDDWLQQLKPGDKVIVSHVFGNNTIATVDRLTATQIVVDGDRYNRTTGLSCGSSSSYYKRYLRKADPKQTERIEHDGLARSLSVVRATEWERVPIDRLRQIKAWVQEAKSAKESNRD